MQEGGREGEVQRAGCEAGKQWKRIRTMGNGRKEAVGRKRWEIQDDKEANEMERKRELNHC